MVVRTCTAVRQAPDARTPAPPLLLLLVLALSGCERSQEQAAPAESQAEEQAPNEQAEPEQTLAVAELVFGLPLPEGAEPILYQPDLRTFSHPAPIEELHRFFAHEIPLAQRESLDRGERFSRPDSEPAVFVFRDPRPGGPSRLAYVPREGEYDHDTRRTAAAPEEEGPGGPTRIVMPDTPHPAIADRPAGTSARSGPITPAEREQLREQSAFRGPGDYITSQHAYAPPGYLQPGSRRGMTAPPRRAHPSEFGGQRQPTGGASHSRFAPANPGAAF